MLPFPFGADQLHPLQTFLRFVLRTAHDDGEFVAAETVDGIDPVKALSEALRRADNKLVARFMSEGVVCLLQAVDVRHDHGAGNGQLLRKLLHLLGIGPPVLKPGHLIVIGISGLQLRQLHGGLGKNIALESGLVDEVPHQDSEQAEYDKEGHGPSENIRTHTAGAEKHQRQKIDQDQHQRCQRIRDVSDRDDQHRAEDDGRPELGFQQCDGDACAEQRNIQRERDRRYKAQVFRAHIEREKQRNGTDHKNDDIDGEAIGVLRVDAGHDQTETPEDELDHRPEDRGFPVVLQDIHPDLFVAFLEDACEQQYVFYL